MLRLILNCSKEACFAVRQTGVVAKLSELIVQFVTELAGSLTGIQRPVSKRRTGVVYCAFTLWCDDAYKVDNHTGGLHDAVKLTHQKQNVWMEKKWRVTLQVSSQTNKWGKIKDLSSPRWIFQHIADKFVIFLVYINEIDVV